MADEQCYKSTGTIRIRIQGDSSLSRESSQKQDGFPLHIFFTPNAEHSVSDGDKKIAIFFSTNSSTDHDMEEVLAFQYDPGKGVSISVQDRFSGLVTAASQQMLVQVEVKRYDKTRLALQAITIPASGKSK